MLGEFHGQKSLVGVHGVAKSQTCLSTQISLKPLKPNALEAEVVITPVLPSSQVPSISALGITIHPAIQAEITTRPLCLPFPCLISPFIHPQAALVIGCTRGQYDKLFSFWSLATHVCLSFALCTLPFPSCPGSASATLWLQLQAPHLPATAPTS